MKLDNFVALIAPTARSKAYLQCLCREGIFPSKIYIMTDDFENLLEEEKVANKISEQTKYFKIDEPILRTINNYKLEYEVINTKNVNDKVVCDVLKMTNAEYIIYSGFGGAILKKELFSLGKKIIHVHAGKLPEYRGSTTAYYSMLDYGKISATAMFMNERLDGGDILYSMDFDIPDDGVNIDYIYEPYTRAMVLVNCINYYINNKKFDKRKQEVERSNTYYIIHPLLKHIALLKFNY